LSDISDFVTIYGDGEKHVFLLPGFLGVYNSWEKNTVYFSERYTLYQINYPDYINTTHGYTFNDFVEHVEEIIKYFGLDEVFLVGHSMGGQVAAVLATRLTNVKKLVLVSSPDTIAKKTKFQKQTHFLSTIDSLKKVLKTIVYDKELDAPDFIQQSTIDLFGSRRKRLKSLIRTLRLNKTTDISKFLKEINIPVLIVWGKNDEVVPVSVASEMKNMISSAKLIVFNKCGHAPQYEVPEKFNIVVDVFLQEDHSTF